MLMALPPNKTTDQAGNILIVDDQIKFSNQLRRIISLEGHKVYEATDPDTVIKIVAKEDIEVILCDNKFTAGDNDLFGKEPADLFAYTEIISLRADSKNPEEEPEVI